MFKHCKRIGSVLAAVAVVSLVCRGLTLAKPPNEDGDKGGQQLAPPGPSSGVIYFWDQGDPYGALGLVVKMNWDGTGVTRLVNSGINHATVVSGWDVSWTNSPRFFIYQTTDAAGVPGLSVDTEGGGSERKIHGDNEFSAWGPALSQDDRNVAFLGVRNGHLDHCFYVAHVLYDEVGLPRGLTIPVEVACSDNGSPSITWSPDGRSIAFTDVANGGILVVPLILDEDGTVTGGGQAVRITPNCDLRGPVWSPWQDDSQSSSRIAAVAPGSNGKGYNIWTLQPDGTGLLLAVSNANSTTASNDCPAWAPDGQQISFRAIQSGGAEAVMRSAADGSTSAKNLTGFSRNRCVRRICWRY